MSLNGVGNMHVRDLSLGRSEITAGTVGGWGPLRTPAGLRAPAGYRHPRYPRTGLTQERVPKCVQQLLEWFTHRTVCLRKQCVLCPDSIVMLQRSETRVLYMFDSRHATGTASTVSGFTGEGPWETTTHCCSVTRTRHDVVMSLFPQDTHLRVHRTQSFTYSVILLVRNPIDAATDAATQAADAHTIVGDDGTSDAFLRRRHQAMSTLASFHTDSREPSPTRPEPCSRLAP